MVNYEEGEEEGTSFMVRNGSLPGGSGWLGKESRECQGVGSSGVSSTGSNSFADKVKGEATEGAVQEAIIRVNTMLGEVMGLLGKRRVNKALTRFRQCESLLVALSKHHN